MHILVDLAMRRLFVKEQEAIIKDYPIGIGRYGCPTPLGVFRVSEIIDKPLEQYSNGEIYGEGCFNLDLRIDSRPYSIHGTNEPNSIGKAESAGCIRLFNEDIEALKEVVYVDMAVIITVSTFHESERQDLFIEQAEHGAFNDH